VGVVCVSCEAKAVMAVSLTLSADGGRY